MHNVNYMCRIMCDTTWDAIGENEHECAVACTKIRNWRIEIQRKVGKSSISDINIHL